MNIILIIDAIVIQEFSLTVWDFGFGLAVSYYQFGFLTPFSISSFDQDDLTHKSHVLFGLGLFSILQFSVL